MRTIWLSDLHFTTDQVINGHDPRQRVRAAIEHINAHYHDASFCVISGDLVDRETPEDYAALKAALDQLAIPYLPMVGNHDDRAMMRSAFSLPKDAMSDFVQYSVEAGDGLVVCLDTLTPGSDAGGFCEKRLAWLRGVLDDAKTRPVYVFMHHPPFELGLRLLDPLRIEQGDELLDLLGAFDCVKHIFFGHVHRPISGVMRGIPFAVMRSVAYQAPPERPEWKWESFNPAAEAPCFGVLEMSGGDVIVQYTQFCEAEFGVTSES